MIIIAISLSACVGFYHEFQTTSHYQSALGWKVSPSIQEILYDYKHEYQCEAFIVPDKSSKLRGWYSTRIDSFKINSNDFNYIEKAKDSTFYREEMPPALIITKNTKIIGGHEHLLTISPNVKFIRSTIYSSFRDETTGKITSQNFVFLMRKHLGWYLAMGE